MYTVCERAVHKIKVITVPFFASYRRKKLNNTDFTIISNNCWGGICYEYFGLPKLSPTIGSYFYAEDYIRFVLNLEYYLNCKMQIINAENSKHFESLQKKGQLDVPVGRIEDVEVIFLHYKNPELALQKWERRVQRVNYDNLIIKFSYMNECTDEIFQQFQSISGVKKIFFIGGRGTNSETLIYLPEYDTVDVCNDTFYWNKHIDVVDLINKPKTSYRKRKMI